MGRDGNKPSMYISLNTNAENFWSNNKQSASKNTEEASPPPIPANTIALGNGHHPKASANSSKNVLTSGKNSEHDPPAAFRSGGFRLLQPSEKVLEYSRPTNKQDLTKTFHCLIEKIRQKFLDF